MTWVVTSLGASGSWDPTDFLVTPAVAAPWGFDGETCAMSELGTMIRADEDVTPGMPVVRPDDVGDSGHIQRTRPAMGGRGHARRLVTGDLLIPLGTSSVLRFDAPFDRLTFTADFQLFRPDLTTDTLQLWAILNSRPGIAARAATGGRAPGGSPAPRASWKRILVPELDPVTWILRRESVEILWRSTLQLPASVQSSLSWWDVLPLDEAASWWDAVLRGRGGDRLPLRQLVELIDGDTDPSHVVGRSTSRLLPVIRPEDIEPRLVLPTGWAAPGFGRVVTEDHDIVVRAVGPSFPAALASPGRLVSRGVVVVRGRREPSAQSLVDWLNSADAQSQLRRNARGRKAHLSSARLAQVLVERRTVEDPPVPGLPLADRLEEILWRD